MKYIANIISSILISFFLVFTGCKKENLDDCFANAGELTIEDRHLPYFEKIELNDNINLIISANEGSAIKVMGGENLIKNINTEVTDSVLIISNSMKCNWVRDFSNELTVTVPASLLKPINYESSGDITTDGKIRIDNFNINVWGGSGTFKLDLECNVLELKLHYGTVDFHVKGTSGITSIFANSYGPFYCAELNSDIVYIRNSGTNDCYIHANHILSAEVTSVGNIYYTGDPYEISSYITGSGKLIKIDQ